MKSSLVLVALLLPGGTVVAGESSTSRPPAAHADCMDAREISRVRVMEGPSLLIASGGERFRVEIGADCGPLQEGVEPSLLAAGGWVCGTGNEFLRNGETLCPVQMLTRLQHDDYTAIAREHDRSRLGATPDQATLEPVRVTASAKRRGFRGDAEYCFPAAAVRGWNTRDGGLVVETSPRRAGGFRRYMVEFTRACKDIHWTRTVEFRSGMGLGVICGNAGDQIVMRSDEIDETALEGDARPTAAVFGMGCAIAMVYPIE